MIMPMVVKKEDKKLQGFFTGISRTRIEFIKKNFKNLIR